MKALLHSFFTLALVSVTLFSCQREPDEELPEEPEPPTSSRGELMVYAELDTVFYPKGLDTITKYSYSYDGSGRVKTILLEDFDGAERLFWRTEERLYNGAERNPYKIILLESEYPTSAPQYYDTVFLSYANGRLSKDSAVVYDSLRNWLGTTSIDYSLDLASGRSHVIRRQYTSWNPLVGIDTTVGRYSIVNGNVLNVTDTVRTEYGVHSIRNYQYQFDDRKNPFLSVVVPSVVPEWIIETSGYERSYISRQGTNNITRIQIDVKGDNVDPVQTTEIRHYIYDADGVVLGYTADGSDLKHVFIYKEK